MSEQRETPTSVGDWMLTMFITVIPLVGIIMLFVWAFGSEQGTSKSNWAKAGLLFYAIFLVLGFLFGGSLIAFMAATGGNF